MNFSVSNVWYFRVFLTFYQQIMKFFLILKWITPNQSLIHDVVSILFDAM